MKKSELINTVASTLTAQGTVVSKVQVEAVLDGFSKVVTQALIGNDEATLPGLGKFSANKRAARTGRNPKTGEPIEIAAATVAKFTPAKALKDALN